MADCCEHGNELLESIDCGEFSTRWGSFELFQEACVSWSIMQLMCK